MNNTDDAKQMLQIIINGQSSFRQEVLSKIDKLDKKIDGVEKSLAEGIDGVRGRLDKIEQKTAPVL